jgi:3',5'-cyclic AMP phosphodiesterase CpdA
VKKKRIPWAVNAGGALALVLATAAAGVVSPAGSSRAFALVNTGADDKPQLVFDVLSDTHVHKNESPKYPYNAHFKTALQDLHSLGDANALIFNGDLVDNGSAADYQQFSRLLQQTPHPSMILKGMGNHEYFSETGIANDQKRFLDFAGRSSIYTETKIGGYSFINLGGDGVLPNEYSPNPTKPWTAVLSDDQLAWLSDTLANEPAGNPIFLFLHQPLENVQQRDRLQQILKQHPNVVYFWSHWHTDLREPDYRLFTNMDGYWRVHTGSTSYSITYVGGQRNEFNVSDGLRVQVYADRIWIRGRDFLGHQWITQFDHTIPLGNHS